MLSNDAIDAVLGRSKRCDWCGTVFNGKVYHFREKNFPEHFACSPSCYEGAVARAIGSPVFSAPPAMNLRDACSRRRP